jgi:hypothetical protein
MICLSLKLILELLRLASFTKNVDLNSLEIFKEFYNAIFRCVNSFLFKSELR